ncbi:conserved Plasmodium protein, unknown function [Plasmodium vinckei vinckei]|uniref:Uncharacterized protein n=1 Tax=Plasmodium vinckei vinckei TaxID=54757 RepID=A0A081IC44_PLAVN|nr:conserved Plasmodium protein, unknown function [Plasmodium vinckei vinckei]KEG01252.1 hypothetical protein YYE_03840 [Plasmodium vinckei vinckei]VEV55227.1 conserved Plasmodium protein, unknown function [Plasmodium vinckei vinckei]
MYYKQYYSYDTVYTPVYYPGYILYEAPRSKDPCCNLAEALCDCVALTITSVASIFLCSADLLIKSCEGR